MIVSKTHRCPICGAIDECDIVLLDFDSHHNCKHCGSTWRENEHPTLPEGPSARGGVES